MAKRGYIPGKEGVLRLWLTNHRAKLVIYQAALGITVPDLTARIAFIDALILKLDANTAAQQVAQGARQALNVQKGISTKGLRKGAQKDKKSDGYTTDIGEQLGIIGDEDAIDENTAKPQLEGKKVGTGTELSFNLLGHFSGVKIFRTRPGGAKLFLASDTSSPYIDTDAQVNGTQYNAYYLLGDDMVGLESNALTIQI